MMVNVGIMSNPGIISSTKETNPAIFPFFPLYIFRHQICRNWRPDNINKSDKSNNIEQDA